MMYNEYLIIILLVWLACYIYYNNKIRRLQQQSLITKERVLEELVNERKKANELKDFSDIPPLNTLYKGR